MEAIPPGIFIRWAVRTNVRLPLGRAEEQLRNDLMTWRLGVDSGGTFTDICLFEESTGRIDVWKVPSTTDDPSQAIAGGAVEAMRRVGCDLRDLRYFGHGTTVGTNSLIQHRGARVGVITTDGFRDLLEIGRQKRPDLYDLQQDKPPVLASRDLRHGIPERLRHDGSVEVPLDEERLREAIRSLKAAGVGAVAVCFLYSFLEPRHEVRTAEILDEEFPEAFHSISNAVSPEFREYERLSTTAVNAFLGPIMRTYINRLACRLSEAGLKVNPHLTQSNGGVIGFDAAARLPVRTVLSGPSTGVVAGGRVASISGSGDCITFDMGGTSTDVALLRAGECRMTTETVVHGYPIKAPMLDIHTVGAGGGSIAYVDTGGLLKVGPLSAGAVPGPVCYAQGNEAPTVTDANVVLQTLNPTHLLGGRMPIRRDLAVGAIERLATQLGLDLMATAQGIVSIVTANMAKAIRVISIQRGHDPRDYTLVAFGGAGPLHSARLARELEMRRVLIPLYPGIMCATGLLLTDLRSDFASTQVKTPDVSELPAIEVVYSGLADQAGHWFDEEGISPGDRVVNRSVDVRYVGQNYEISVPLRTWPLDAQSLRAVVEDFEAEHRRVYGFAAEGEPVHLITFRLEAQGVVPKAEFSNSPAAGQPASIAVSGMREVWMPEAGGFVACKVYDRSKFGPGHSFEGPAIVEQMDATTVVLPGMSVTVDPYLNLIMEFA